MLATAEAVDLTRCFGLGVAGNFAGHLEQAGEAGDFAGVDAAAEAPKGVFPWYVPGDAGFLGEFPISDSELILPESDEPLNLQIEPEAGVICSLEYAEGSVVRVVPEIIAAFNDSSIRRPGARRISEKKNWGACSKGFAAGGFAISEIERGGATSGLRIASFLRRDGTSHKYGIDSPVAGYSYYGEQLLGWIADRLYGQADAGPLEDVGAMIENCGRPERVLVGIGATRYTQFGESNFLRPGDESVIVLYESDAHSADEVAAAVGAGSEAELAAASALTQRVLEAPHSGQA